MVSKTIYRNYNEVIMGIANKLGLRLESRIGKEGIGVLQFSLTDSALEKLSNQTQQAYEFSIGDEDGEYDSFTREYISEDDLYLEGEYDVNYTLSYEENKARLLCKNEEVVDEIIIRMDRSPSHIFTDLGNIRKILDSSGEEYITELLTQAYRLKEVLDNYESDLRYLLVNDLGYINRQLKVLGYKTRKEGYNINVGKYTIRTIRCLKLEYDLADGEIVSRATPLLYDICIKESNISNFTMAELEEDLRNIMG